jgi:hypothetical protein
MELVSIINRRRVVCVHQNPILFSRYVESHGSGVFGRNFDFAFLSCSPKPECLLRTHVFLEPTLSCSIMLSGGPARRLVCCQRMRSVTSIQVSWYNQLRRMAAYSALVDAQTEHPTVHVHIHASTRHGDHLNESRALGL